jgi:hypothetical protein
MNIMTFAHFMTKRTTERRFGRGISYRKLFAAALSDAHRLVKRYGGNVLTEGLVAARAKGMEELARRMQEAKDIDARIERETSVVRSIVSSAIAQGYMISLFDGEEWAIKQATTVQEIMQGIMTTDCDKLRFRKRDDVGTPVGTVFLVYGNLASEVINDWSDNEATAAILKNALAQCERYSLKGW